VRHPGEEEFMSVEATCSESQASQSSGNDGAVVVKFESPPAAPAPARQEFDPRARLHELALELVRTRNRRLMVEYLRLRRAVR
jgi:hypothetical protein